MTFRDENIAELGRPRLSERNMLIEMRRRIERIEKLLETINLRLAGSARPTIPPERPDDPLR